MNQAEVAQSFLELQKAAQNVELTLIAQDSYFILTDHANFKLTFHDVFALRHFLNGYHSGYNSRPK